MIIRDSRTPFGRIEHQPSRFQASLLKPVVGAMGEGQTWRLLNELGTRSWLFGHPSSRPGPVTKQCEECGRPFPTTRPALAKMCGAACRQRAYKRRRRKAA